MCFIARFRSIAVAILVAGLAAGCSTPYKVPHFVSSPPGDVQFPGVLTLAEAARPGALDVLLVHGMCTHDLDWAVKSIERLGKSMGAELLYPAGNDVTLLDGIYIYQRTLRAPTGTVRANAIVWSPLVARLKTRLCADQSTPSDLCQELDPCTRAYPHERAHLNAWAKDMLLNDCIADALIYQGHARKAISRQLQQAILIALASSGGRSAPADVAQVVARETAPLVLISESLGSKMALDAIDRLLHDPDSASARAAGQATLDRLVQIFLGANQVPLLALADQNLDGTEGKPGTDFPSDPLAALLGLRQDRAGQFLPRPPRVVAFTDPNDVLSYALVPARLDKPYRLVDVIVSNATTYLGSLENPYTAHLGYRENSEVMKLIACGNPLRPPCTE